MRKSFWIHLVLDPFTALDLVDKDGKPDHGKILPAILLFSAIVLQFIDKQYTAAVLITLGSLSYGYGMWRSFLKSKAVTSVESLQRIDTTITKRDEEIRARRNVHDGIDPTYE